MQDDIGRVPISLAYAPTDTEHIYLESEVQQGSQLIDVLQQVGWLSQYPELAQWCQQHKLDTQIDKKAWRVGVFSDKKPLTYVVEAHDRIEVYRPLTIDPMNKRKKRAIQR